MRRLLFAAVLLGALFIVLVSALFAQSNEFEMRVWNISGVGGESTTAISALEGFELHGNLEFVDSTVRLEGEGFTVRSGFGAAAHPPDFKFFVPVIIAPSPTPIISLPTGTPDRPGPGRPTRVP